MISRNFPNLNIENFDYLVCAVMRLVMILMNTTIFACLDNKECFPIITEILLSMYDEVKREKEVIPLLGKDLAGVIGRYLI